VSTDTPALPLGELLYAALIDAGLDEADALAAAAVLPVVIPTAAEVAFRRALDVLAEPEPRRRRWWRR
jgi:hypothetical protein